jgi:hypothetical protein
MDCVTENSHKPGWNIKGVFGCTCNVSRLTLAPCHICGVPKTPKVSSLFGLSPRLRLGTPINVWRLFGLLPHLRLDTPLNVRLVYRLTQFVPHFFNRTELMKQHII